MLLCQKEQVFEEISTECTAMPMAAGNNLYIKVRCLELGFQHQ